MVANQQWKSKCPRGQLRCVSGLFLVNFGALYADVVSLVWRKAATCSM
jgi:hypothetical protein